MLKTVLPEAGAIAQPLDIQDGDLFYFLGDGTAEVVRGKKRLWLVKCDYQPETKLRKRAAPEAAKGGSGTKHPPIPEGARWISIRPGGNPSAEAQPVLILPQPDGSARVIGGAGGKLNMLKLDKLGTAEDWKQKAKLRAQEKREKEKERQAKLSEKEQEKEKKAKKKADDLKRTATHSNALKTLEVLEKVGVDIGLTTEHKLALQKPPDEGAEPETLEQWQQLTREATQRVKAVHQAYENKLVTDQDARAAALIGDDDPEVAGRIVENQAHTAASTDGNILSEMVPLPDGGWLVSSENGSKTFDNWADAAKHHVQNVEQAEQDLGGDRTQPDAFYSQADWVKDVDADGFTFKPEVALEIARLSATRKAIARAEIIGEETDALDAIQGDGYIGLKVKEITEAEVIAKLEQHAKTLKDAAVNADFLGIIRDVGDAKKLKKHVQTGEWAALSEVASEVFKQTPISRELVDLLGHAESAKVLAYMMAQNLSEDDYEATKEAIAAFHAKQSTLHARGATKQVRKMQERLAALHEGMVGLNEFAKGDLDPVQQIQMDSLMYEAETLKNGIQEVLGTRLGQLQASAALVAAMEAKPQVLRFAGDTAERIAKHVPGLFSGGESEQDSPSVFAAYGLTPEDFELQETPTGEDAITIKRSGLAKLAVGYNPEDQEAYERAIAIKRGDYDEDGFIPEGFSHYQKLADFQPAEMANAYGIQPDVNESMTDDELYGKLQEYLGAVVASGVSPIDAKDGIYNRDFPRAFGIDPDSEFGDRLYRTIGNIIRDIAEINDDRGRRISLQALINGLTELSQRHQEKQWQDGEGVHGKGLIRDAAVEAAHRTLASSPMFQIALKPYNELSAAERKKLREYAVDHVWRPGQSFDNLVKNESLSEAEETARQLAQPGKHGESKTVAGRQYVYHKEDGWLNQEQWERKQQAEQELAGLEQGGLFDLGDFQSSEPVETAPSLAEAEVVDDWADVRETDDPWTQFSKLMRGSDRAYAVALEHLRGQFNQRFAHAYQQLAGEPAPLVSKTHSHFQDYLISKMSAAERKQFLAKQRQRDQSDSAKLRTRGAGGRFLAEDEGWYEDYQATKGEALQGNLGVGVDDPNVKRPTVGGSYSALGNKAQAELNDVLKDVLPNFEQITAKKVDIYPEVNWGKGTQHAMKQRVLKLLEAQKKIGLHAGAGSGKSATMLGAFSHLHAQGKVKKMVVGVPSSIVSQFVGEAVTFLEPGKYNYAANLGWSREQRIEALKDPNMHVFVSTRESLTNDLLYLVEKHTGVNSDAFREKSKEEQHELLLRGCKAEGINPEEMLLSVDEAHDLAQRKGVEASKRSLALKGMAQHAAYYIEATGDPQKNDASEMFSFLSTVAPDKFNDLNKFMAEYGSNTASAKRALQRAIAPYSFAFATKPQAKPTEQGKQGRTLRMNSQQPKIKVSSKMAEQRQRILDDISIISKWQSAKREQLRTQYGDKYQPTAEDFNEAWDDPDVRAAVDRLGAQDTWHALDDDGKRAAIGGQVRAMGGLKRTALFRMVHLTPYEDNPKMQWTVEHAVEQHKAGRPGIIFSSSSKACEQIVEQLEKRGLTVAYIHGGLDSTGKGEQAQLFQKEAKADVLIATDAARTGVNLTRAKYVVHYDVPLTEMSFAQRSARSYRLGQNTDVDIFVPMLDMPEEHQSYARMERKGESGKVFKSRSERIDDTGLARSIREYRRSQGQKAA